MLIVFLTTLSITVVTYFWALHVAQSLDSYRNYDGYGWSGYRGFKKQLNKKQWIVLPHGYLVDENEMKDWSTRRKTELGFTLIKIDNILMIINNPVSYFFVIVKIIRTKSKIRGSKYKHKWE